MPWLEGALKTDASKVGCLPAHTPFPQDLLPEAVPAFKEARVVDSYVQRYYGAVTWFSPGSFNSRPPLETSISNLVCAGDWVRMGEREHGAKGLCQVGSSSL